MSQQHAEDAPCFWNEYGRESSSRVQVPAVDGLVDRLTSREASGWAYLCASPEVSVEVEATIGEKVIARAKANLLRADLLAEGKSNAGSHGFRILFEEPLSIECDPKFRVVFHVGTALAYSETLPSVPLLQIKEKCDLLKTLLNDHLQFTTSGPECEELDTSILNGMSRDIGQSAPLLIAFYLPQFHRIPENDQLWGAGFTEWQQLPRSISRFPGHYQPRIPRDLGFYNLTNISAIRAQIELAKSAGIGAFGFYYYRFGQHRVLDAPLELFLKSDLEMPFIIIWGNESWTKIWQGTPDCVVVKQTYEVENEESLLEDLCRHFNDKRYVLICGRPLFVIYSPRNIPNARETIERWRRGLTAKCGVEPLMFMAQSYGDRDPRLYGLDGALEFPPHKLAEQARKRVVLDAYDDWFRGTVIQYDDIVAASLEEYGEAFPLIKTVVPSWDNDARRPNRGLTLTGLSPKKYQDWLKLLITHAIRNPILGTPIVAINAWNEWAEGAYLEPDIYYGASYLNATARAYTAALRERGK